MNQKFFPLDKNYILRQAQESAEAQLLPEMVAILKESYVQLFNPLGLQDSLSRQIAQASNFPTAYISAIYHQLAGIYRYKFGSNQLEFLFDGRTHLEKYQEDWTVQLCAWMRFFCQDETFVKAVLKMTILFDKDTRAICAENMIKVMINEHFAVKVIKRKGVLKLKTA